MSDGSMRRGARQDLPPAPLPQGERGKPAVNTQVVNGFWQFLPSKTTTFFKRVYFVTYPKPLFIAGLPGFPVRLPVAKLEVPKSQAFILKNFSFGVSVQSGIGKDNLIEYPPMDVASYLGFEVKIGNRSPYDFASNVTQRGTPIAYKPAQAGGTAPPPVPGGGTVYPFGGPQQPLAENYAFYAMASESMDFNAWVLQEPPFDTRLIHVTVEGYNINQSVLEKILERISG